MEWYMSNKAHDLLVPNDQCVHSNFASKEKCYQCGLNTIDECDVSLANDGDFSCQTLVDVDRLEMNCLIGDVDQSELSDVHGGISDSSNYWTSLLNNQDYLLDGFPWTNQTDENFLNALLIDDLRASDQFHVTDSLNSHCTSSTEINVTTNWDMEREDMMMMISSDPQELCERNFVDENHSIEATVLTEFDSAVQKMSNETRLCFRDAMYRLATNSEKQSSEKRIKTAASYQHFSRKVEEDVTEHKTNTIDRTVADLLFNKPYQHNECHQQPYNRYLQKQFQLTMQPAFIRGR